MPLPNFFIVGANKGGTTSLHSYLGQHPQVFTSRNKEPMFFRLEGEDPSRFAHDPSVRLHWKGGIFTWEDYLKLFDGAESATSIGEASTAYLAVSGVAERIHRRLPNSKIIAVLRDPVDRAFSNYRMYVRRGLETLPTFEAAIAAEPQRIREGYSEGWSYVGLGFYYENLKQYMDLFGPDRVRVYLFEADLEQEPLRMLKDLFGFLGVDDHFVPDISRRLNTAEDPPPTRARNSGLGRMLPGRMRAMLARRLGSGHGALQAPMARVNPQTRRRLIEQYRPDILKLQGLIRRNLSHWLS